ncbi:hypothetical protein VNI00_010822 [Paramarasmius palmivorus]|uniref:Uncharacterized protein n=1 Tax=Paramarasmius palmivorus TaxID=297713 RepID=A0AAW0CEP4_9AGAR
MRVQHYSHNDYTNFINLLNCPALTSLTFGMPVDFRSVIMKPNMMYFRQALTAFVKRSPGIRSFYLGYTEFDDEDVFGILKEMRELVLLSVAMTKSLNTWFMEVLGVGWPVPKLKELRLDWYSKGFDWDAWREMLLCRWTMKCSLGSAYLEIRRGCVPEDVRNWVRDRQQEGKAVRILCKHDATLEFYRYWVQEQTGQFLTT